MIDNVKEVSLEDFTTEEVDSGWWTFDEFCDACKNQVAHAGLFAQNSLPNFSRSGLCLDCAYGKSTKS